MDVLKKGLKRTEAERLRSIINMKLAELLQKNRFRIDFQERLEKIVNDYNMGSINKEEYFQKLTELINGLQIEEKRHVKEGLTEEELAVFDILTKPEPKLTKKKEQIIKTIAKELLEKLKEQNFVLDWKKRTRTRADVQVTIEDILWERLPKPEYTSEMKKEKLFLSISTCMTRTMGQVKVSTTKLSNINSFSFLEPCDSAYLRNSVADSIFFVSKLFM